MSADEMFEKLGAYKTETESYITYTGEINKNHRVLFNKNANHIVFEGFNAIDMQELQAINAKAKELGWVE